MSVHSYMTSKLGNRTPKLQDGDFQCVDVAAIGSKESVLTRGGLGIDSVSMCQEVSRGHSTLQ